MLACSQRPRTHAAQSRVSPNPLSSQDFCSGKQLPSRTPQGTEGSVRGSPPSPRPRKQPREEKQGDPAVRGRKAGGTRAETTTETHGRSHVRAEKRLRNLHPLADSSQKAGRPPTRRGAFYLAPYGESDEPRRSENVHSLLEKCQHKSLKDTYEAARRVVRNLPPQAPQNDSIRPDNLTQPAARRAAAFGALMNSQSKEVPQTPAHGLSVTLNTKLIRVRPRVRGDVRATPPAGGHRTVVRSPRAAPSELRPGHGKTAGTPRSVTQRSGAGGTVLSPQKHSKDTFTPSAPGYDGRATGWPVVVSAVKRPPRWFQRTFQQHSFLI